MSIHRRLSGTLLVWNWTIWNITSVALYNHRADRTENPVVLSVSADRTENPVVLLVSADSTENISRGSYFCINCRRDVFTSALRINVRDADLLENSLSVEVCLPSRCLATHWENALQYQGYWDIKIPDEKKIISGNDVNFFQRWIIYDGHCQNLIFHNFYNVAFTS
jgi:hypothetical protein